MLTMQNFVLQQNNWMIKSDDIRGTGSMKQKNVLIGQSGGPSVAINATLAGVIAAAQQNPSVDRIYGMRHGIEGVLADNLIDLTDFDRLEALKATPAMALGSCRHKLPGDISHPDYQTIDQLLKKYEIGYVFYIGGNDSMDTAEKLHSFYEGKPDSPKIIGLPKTIDNDLPCTDHTPGFGSAARYLAVTVNELIRDTAIYNVPSVTIVEIMGRDSGWLTLAAALPHFMGGDKPDIIAIPEIPFSEEAFLDRVRELLPVHRNVLAVVSEGLRDSSGQYVGSQTKSGVVDIFGHQYLSGVGKYLEGLVKHQIGCKVRSIELNLMQRCSSHLASKTDVDESFAVGQAGFAAALQGESGRMLAIRRVSDQPYTIAIETIDISQAANRARLVPQKWFDLENPVVQQEICRYLLPLIQGEQPQFCDEYGFADYVVF